MESTLRSKIDKRRSGLRTLFDDAAGNSRGRVIGIYSVLLVFNAAAWLWAVLAFRHFPVLLGTAFLAYSFGLRHAVDADHIAAIDNVTRKLMQEGKRPVGVGFMFSLGHSTIVVLGSIAIAWTALTCSTAWTVREIGGVSAPWCPPFFCLGLRPSMWLFCNPFTGRSSKFARASHTSMKIWICCWAIEGYWAASFVRCSA